MIPTSGDPGNKIYYSSRNKIAIQTGGTDRVEVGDATTTVSNNLSVTGDVNAAGGFAMPLILGSRDLIQGGFVSLSSSYISGSATLAGFDFVPAVRSGSVLGFVLNVPAGQCVKSGALSGAVMINGVNTTCTITGHTGTFFLATAVSKGTVTFNPGQRIGVSLSASADYLCEPDILSASFIATVLVEM